MAWTVPFTRCISSPEPAEASSPTASPASSQSAPSSSMTTPAESSPCAGPEWPSGTTSAPSAQTTPTAPPHSLGSASTPESSSWPGGSRAKIFQRPEKEKGSPPANARASGASLPASFARYDRDSHSWKIPQCLFLEDCTSFSGTWPRSGILRDGTCYQLPPWAPATSASESGLPASTPPPPLFPTVTINGNNNFKGVSAKAGDGLHTFIRKMEGTWGDKGQWPTPNARDWKDTGASQGRRHSPNLGTAVHTHTHTHTATRVPEIPDPASARRDTRNAPPARLGDLRPEGAEEPQRSRSYPTPRVHDATHDGPSELTRHAPNLATIVRLIP